MNENQPTKPAKQKAAEADQGNKLIAEIEKAITTATAAEPSVLLLDAEKQQPPHPTVQHGEALAKHLEAVMADYNKRVSMATDLIRRTVKQLAEDQTKIEQHLDAITKGCEDISKVGNHH
jgi:hypothetical protein